jgi:mRNA-degrading endonuclease RelE of RelBE toxin-antitoxin system
MHKFEVSGHLRSILAKVSKKNRALYKQIFKKMDEIINCYDVEHYKNLRYNMKESKRAHIGHFVLVFRFDRQKDIVYFEDFDHHDKMYR